MILQDGGFDFKMVKKKGVGLVRQLLCFGLFIGIFVFSTKQTMAKAVYGNNKLDIGGEKIVVGYVTSWTKELPSAKYLTHINYAFGHVNKQFNGIRVDNPNRLKSIVALKKQKPSLKVCLSIGGWGSGGFSEMVSNKSSRDSFANDCLAKLKEFDLDGIDIDWEYPTSSSAKISSSSDDKENYTLLMKSIRVAIGPDKLLTLASSAGGGYIDFKAIEPVIDFVNIMTYDMSGAPKHHSGLYRSSNSAYLTGNESVKKHVAAGVPVSKLVLGIPFYGHGRDPLPGWMDYKDIINLKGYEFHWDDSAKAPYITDTTGKILMNYDNPASIAIKGQYILDNGLLGGMFWDYKGDTKDGELQRVLFESLGLRSLDAGGKETVLKPLDKPAFSVIGFYSASYDPAHISFAHEANKWFSDRSKEFNFNYDSSKNWELLNDKQYMKNYQVVIFLDNVPPSSIRKGFESYMKNGGGFIGFHVTAYNDKEHVWDWYYKEFLGCGRFKGNTWRPTNAILKVEDTNHPITNLLPVKFEAAPNEWYKWENNLREKSNFKVLLSIDSSSFPLGTGPKPFEIWHGGDYPVVWTNTDYRMVYINMGHNDMDYEHKYGKGNGTISQTFSSVPECRAILNALFWIGTSGNSTLPDLPIQINKQLLLEDVKNSRD